MNYPPYPLSRRTKSTIFALFTAIFFIVAPTLALYTAGYRINTHSFGITRIGVLSVDIEPPDAHVFLNNKEVGNLLPLRLTNLIPGTYNLRIEKTGYLPLIKDIVVEQNKTTYIKNINLFSVSKPEPLEMNEDLAAVYGSFDGNYILQKFQNDQGTHLVLYDTVQERATSLLKSSTSSFDVVWSDTSDTFAVFQKNIDSTEIFFVAANNPVVQKSLKLETPITSFQWKQNFYSENFIVRSNQLIYTLNGNIFSRPIVLTNTSSIWYVDNDDQNWFFDKETQSLSNEKENLFVGDDTVKKIVQINKSRAIVQTEKGLVIIQRNDSHERKTIDTTNFFYDENRKEYIAWSPWELWTVYQNGQIALLNRMSEAIVQVAALDQSGELLVITADKILGFNPGYYLTQEILSDIQMEKTSVNQKAKTIYFFGTWNSKKGLYKLQY